MIIRFVCVLNLMCRADTVQTMCHFYNSSQNFPVSCNCKLPIGWEGRYVSKSCFIHIVAQLYDLCHCYLDFCDKHHAPLENTPPRPSLMSGASSGACLGHHLGHVWGSLRESFRKRETEKVCHKDKPPRPRVYFFLGKKIAHMFWVQKCI